MKSLIKENYPGELTIRQDLWKESPCLKCTETYCCRNLPLAQLRLNNQSDFIKLIQASCYEDVFPVLKKTGEWAFYLERDCSFYQKEEGSCSIHKASHQSQICKSYDAHNCWYIDAFGPSDFNTMIRFDTKTIIRFEKSLNLIKNRFDVEFNWEELCGVAHDNPRDTASHTVTSEPWESLILSFKNSRSDQFLFMPPYERPKKQAHFELLSFRLSFPGIYLAVSDTCWAFMVRTDMNQDKMNLIRNEYYPSLGHKDGAYSFDSVMKEHSPSSGMGDQWVILQRSDLTILKSLTTFDATGGVQKIPSTWELLKSLKAKGTG